VVSAVNVMLLSGAVKNLQEAKYVHESLNGLTTTDQQTTKSPNDDADHGEDLERVKLQELMLTNAAELIYTKQSTSRFLQINDILMQGLLTNMEIALVDMPEVLLRMNIAHNHSLEDLQDIFNFIMNKVSRKEGPCLTPGQAA